MQLLFESSSENDGAWGLGLLQGRVERLPAPGLKVPHIGWNVVRWSRTSRLTADLPDESPFYFVHSYHLIPDVLTDAVATTPYCGGFVSAVAHGTIYGVQFHPEKSSAHGLQLLENFAGLCAGVATPS